MADYGESWIGFWLLILLLEISTVMTIYYCCFFDVLVLYENQICFLYGVEICF